MTVLHLHFLGVALHEHAQDPIYFAPIKLVHRTSRELMTHSLHLFQWTALTLGLVLIYQNRLLFNEPKTNLMTASLLHCPKEAPNLDQAE